MTKFTDNDFKYHLKSSINTGVMSNEIFVSELAWNPEVEIYDELSLYSGSLSRLTPKDFKQNILYRVGQMKANINDRFLVFDNHMEPLIGAGDTRYTFFDQSRGHKRIRFNSENGMSLTCIFATVLLFSAI